MERDEEHKSRSFESFDRYNKKSLLMLEVNIRDVKVIELFTNQSLRRTLEEPVRGSNPNSEVD